MKDKETITKGMRNETNKNLYYNGYLLGFQDSDIEELNFLEEHLSFIRNARKDISGLQPFQYPIEARIKQLNLRLETQNGKE